MSDDMVNDSTVNDNMVSGGAVTSGMVMVQWADLTGGGFRRHEVGPPAPREFWAAAEQLLQADLSQPPEGIRSTVGHPVWTLRRVAVRGRWTWCFVVQGRRGPFGVAGSCRFAFAPEDMPAFDAWHAGRAVAAAPEDTATGDATDDATTADTVAAGDDGELLAAVLGGIVTGRQAVPVEAPPGAAADLIPRVLGVLPEAVARDWSWSTCALKRPDARRVVSGRWPDEFRRSDPGRASMIDQLFRHGTVPADEVKRRLGSEEAAAGFEWLVDFAIRGTRPPAELLTGDDLVVLVTELGQDRRPPEVGQVGVRLRTARGRASLRGHAGLVRAWAHQQPYEACRELPSVDDDRLRPELLRGLVDAQGDTAENLLGLPDPPADLAALYGPKELRTVLARWAAPGGVLAALDARAAARGWFLRLGLRPHTDPHLFQPRPAFAADTINRDRAATADALREVELAANPLTFLEQVVPGLNPLPPRAAGALLRCAMPDVARPSGEDVRALRGLAHDLTAAVLAAGGSDTWIDELLAYVGHEPRHPWEARTVMYGAMTALLERHTGEPRPELLARCRGLSPGHDAPQLLREVLELARRRADQPRGEQPRVDQSRAGQSRPGAVYRSRAQRLHQLVHQVFPPRVRGFTAVAAVSALVGAAATGAFTLPRRPGPAPAAVALPSIATAAASGQPDPLQLDLGGRAARGDQVYADLQTFQRLYRPPAGAVPAAVLLIADENDRPGSGPTRANNLHDALRRGPFEGVPVEVVERPSPGPGTLRAIVYFNRPS